MLNMTTSIDRFAHFENLKSLEGDREAPMTVDAELGMPLLPGMNDVGYWLGQRARYNPEPDPHFHVDEDDQALLAEPTVPVAQAAQQSSNTPVSMKAKEQAAFVNKKPQTDTTLIKREETLTSFKDEPMEPVPAEEQDLDPRQSRLKAILASFAAVQQPLSSVTHPSNRTRVAEKQFPVLPDELIYGNSFSLIRYPDDPKRKDPANPNAESDALTQTALLRPVQIPDDDPRVAYYLAESEESANGFRRTKWQKPSIDQGTAENHIPEAAANFRCVRHYDALNIRNYSDDRDFVLTIDDGEPAPGSVEEGLAPPRSAGIYYAPISTHQTLKVRRPRRGEDQMEYGPMAAETGLVAWHSMEIMLGINSEALTEAEVTRRRMAAITLMPSS